MEVLHINSSVLIVFYRPLNITTGEQTLYEQCKDMPAVLIWYLCLQFFNMFVGIPANLMVLWLIHKNKGDSSTSDIFILHLAVLDVFFCAVPPLELTNLVFITTKSTQCIQRFFDGVIESSLLFHSCICLDRYVAVVHPITFTKLKDRNHRAVLVTVIWLLTLAYAAAKCVGNITHFYIVFAAMILTAFPFMVFCNISILRVLRKSGPGRDEMHPVKKRAFKIVLLILAIIMFNYLPLVVLFPFRKYFSPDVFRCYIHYIAFGLMDLSSSIQPLLYLSKEKLPWCLNCC
uniref:proteinase-activated receptor 3 n=1 Tax=Monopterus albus TaxID=43700 RepID=UPI0009B4B433|nr:proteinase-activated receptor 3-like [Monopterus albus]